MSQTPEKYLKLIDEEVTEKRMQITIDTKTDSKDEIRKAIKLLMGLVSGHEVYTNETPVEKPAAQPNIFESSEPAVPNLMSMFDSAPTTNTETEKKEEDKAPEIEFY